MEISLEKEPGHDGDVMERGGIQSEKANKSVVQRQKNSEKGKAGCYTKGTDLILTMDRKRVKKQTNRRAKTEMLDYELMHKKLAKSVGNCQS